MIIIGNSSHLLEFLELITFVLRAFQAEIYAAENYKLREQRSNDS